MTRKIMVAGNWKANKTIAQSVDLANGIKKIAEESTSVDILIAPQFTAIKSVADALAGSAIKIAGQNVLWEVGGAFTGEVAPFMLKDAGCKWAIIGHSERRQYFAETDETVNRRLKIAQKEGLNVIVCVGETLDERMAGKTFEVLDRQIEGAFKDFGRHSLEPVVIAYEPVWAIGTGKTATPEEADEAHANIRKKIGELFGDVKAKTIRILYGGSVNAGNAETLFKCENIDGGLVGGASLKAYDFALIIKAGVQVSG
ncbi:Triosephosphate isomerase [hydrothermal vent metagenome]|uniref:triose-phosphate isomerase n=1 Tax=hydrothermal vent metagenome TaxID=652676 RepID=A0A3B1CHS9_9ZZZZ